MKKHLLLIDPNKEELKVFMSALEDLDTVCKCTYTDSCMHAEQMLEFLTPDAVFVGIEPKITESLEFVKHLKHNKKFRHVPVMVYATHMPYYNYLARGHGADHCMQKSNDPSEIRKMIEA